MNQHLTCRERVFNGIMEEVSQDKSTEVSDSQEGTRTPEVPQQGLDQIEQAAKEQARQENLKVMSHLEELNKRMPGFCVTLGEGDERLVVLGHGLDITVLHPTDKLGIEVEDVAARAVPASWRGTSPEQMLGPNVELTYKAMVIATQEGFKAVMSADRVHKAGAPRGIQEGLSDRDADVQRIILRYEDNISNELRRKNIEGTLANATTQLQWKEGFRETEATPEQKRDWFIKKVGLDRGATASVDENGQVQVQGKQLEVISDCPPSLVTEAVRFNQQILERQMQERMEQHQATLAESQKMYENARIIGQMLGIGQTLPSESAPEVLPSVTQPGNAGTKTT